MRYAQPGALVAITFYNLPTGLVGTLGVRVMEGASEITARTTAGIVEAPPGSGVYTATVEAPPLGTYQVTVDDTTAQPSGFASETLVVTSSGTPALSPGPAGGGPCSLWTSAEAIADCCEGTFAGSALEYAALVATDVLYGLSGGRYVGRCRAVVRPSNLGARGCGPWVFEPRRWPRGCRALSEVLLAGWPVREVEQVRLDGDVLDPAEYRLWDSRYLMRATEAAVWPSCQYLERDPSEDGTFEVTYTYGADPPVAGQLAATKLACEIAKACGGAACNLPSNFDRLVRQGVQVSAKDTKGGAFGIPEVDLFIATQPTRGRRPAVVSPDSRPYPLVVSIEPAGEDEGS